MVLGAIAGLAGSLGGGGGGAGYSSPTGASGASTAKNTGAIVSGGMSSPVSWQMVAIVGVVALVAFGWLAKGSGRKR